MSQYAPPPHPPPTSRPAESTSPSGNERDETQITDEPPPAYTPSASTGQMSLQSGPAHVDFSGPPPLPSRLENNITGVGVGYGPRPQHTGPYGPTGGGGGPSAGQAMGRPPPPPVHPDRTGSHYSSGSYGKGTGEQSEPGTPIGNMVMEQGQAGQVRPPPPRLQDSSPTEVPTPGRPLLHRGQLLVYPKGHFCHKCGNTGYKANDPSNPHESDWRKYGKPYTSALANSYKVSSDPGANASTASASNFQRPLPAFSPSPQYGQSLPPVPQQGGWNSYPGHYRPPPPPPQAMPYGNQGVYVQHTSGIPQGALVVGPGDPRIGGRLCWRCGGDGREVSFFGFDDGRCWECRGLGRVFP